MNVMMAIGFAFEITTGIVIVMIGVLLRKRSSCA